MPIKVLVTVPSLSREYGGPAAKAPALGAALQALGHEVTVVGAGQASPRGVISSTKTIALRPVAYFHGTPISLACYRLAQLVRKSDVVHLIGYRDPVTMMAALAAWLLGRPYLVEPVGTHRRQLRSLRLKALFDLTVGRRMLEGASLIVATSEREVNELREDGVLPKKIALRPNGIQRVSPGQLPGRGRLRRRLGLTLDVPLILSLTRIVRTKGLPMLVDAASRIPRAHLVVAGPDAEDGTLPELIEIRRRLRLEDRVHVLPLGLWGDEKLEAFVDADLFCLFSQTESFGIVAAEAASVGLPVVVSDRCGVADWLKGGAYVAQFGDVEGLATILSRLLNDSDQRASLATRGRVAAEALTWERVAAQQAELYQEARCRNSSRQGSPFDQARQPEC